MEVVTKVMVSPVEPIGDSFTNVMHVVRLLIVTRVRLCQSVNGGPEPRARSETFGSADASRERKREAWPTL